MSKDIPLYPWSSKEARKLGEEKEWLKSFKANCDCARAIESAITDKYTGSSLPECAKEIISQYGFDRVNKVLATTIQQNSSDGRYSPENKKWADSFYFPNEDKAITHVTTVNSHPGLVNIFTDQARQQWDSLRLYDKSHCQDGEKDGIDYTGKVVAIRPSALKDEYKTPEYQLFYASGGNGCRPKALGVKVFGEFLKDGERDCYGRGDIIGVVKPELLPEWAAQRYAEITGGDEETEALTIGEPK